MVLDRGTGGPNAGLLNTEYTKYTKMDRMNCPDGWADTGSQRTGK
jgi:hypothetical protein